LIHTIIMKCCIRHTKKLRSKSENFTVSNYNLTYVENNILKVYITSSYQVKKSESIKSILIKTKNVYTKDLYSKYIKCNYDMERNKSRMNLKLVDDNSHYCYQTWSYEENFEILTARFSNKDLVSLLDEIKNYDCNLTLDYVF